MSNLACRARQLSQHHDQFHADHIWSYPYGIIKSVIATITTIWLLRPKAVSKQLLSNQGKPMPIWGQDLDRRFVVIYQSPWSRSGWVWQIWQDSSSRGQTEIQVPSTNYEILNQNFKSQPMNWLTSFPKKKYCTLAIVIWQKTIWSSVVTRASCNGTFEGPEKAVWLLHILRQRVLHFAKFRQAVLDAKIWARNKTKGHKRLSWAKVIVLGSSW